MAPEIRWDVVEHWQFLYGKPGKPLADRQLAKLMGISGAHYCDVKRGYRKATSEFIDALVEATRMSYDRLCRHPSINPEQIDPHHPEIGLLKKPSGAPLDRLCRDPEHKLPLNRRDFRQAERQAVQSIPVESRKQLWPRPKWWFRKNS